MIPIPYLPEKMPATHHLLFLPVSGRKYIKNAKTFVFILGKLPV
jgi:hypothetical protein